MFWSTTLDMPAQLQKYPGAPISYTCLNCAFRYLKWWCCCILNQVTGPSSPVLHQAYSWDSLFQPLLPATLLKLQKRRNFMQSTQYTTDLHWIDDVQNDVRNDVLLFSHSLPFTSRWKETQCLVWRTFFWITSELISRSSLSFHQ